MNKKAQVTIFVIIAIVLVIGVALIFILKNNPGVNIQPVENPEKFIEECVTEELKEVEELVLANNGFLEGNDNTFLYLNEEIPYLCKASQFYIACTPQQPAFLEKIRQDIEEASLDKLESCFSDLIKDMERRGEVIEGDLSYRVDIRRDSIKTSINKQIIFTQESEVQSFENFDSKIQSPLYDLVNLAQIIVNFQTTYCEFNKLNWALNYPEIKINEFRASDQTKVYNLENKETGKDISFAIKTCLLPAGI